MTNPNLLSITSIPISVEISVTKAQLKNPNDPRPQIRVTTGDGGIQIEAEPTKIKIDTYAARSSMGLGNKNYADFYKGEASKGMNLAYKGTARIVSDGNSLARGTTPGELAIKNTRAGASIQTIMEHIPKTGADVTFDEGTLNINYEVKDLDIDWANLKSSPMQFVPGRVDINITQMPKVIIEYRGDPIYVPASSNPKYDSRA
ncbi:MAG: DUF6470 family protein [Oscillospiraceae bacterium]|nr:DUF6470 family protein [Oscillospiraceae bacterium]